MSLLKTCHLMSNRYVLSLLPAHISHHFVVTPHQAHPDAALLTTPSLLGTTPFDDTAKINVVHRDSEPSTRPMPDAAGGLPPPRKEKEGKYSEAQTPPWEKVKDIVLRPSVAGGLVGVGRSA